MGDDTATRQAIIDTCRAMESSGLIQGTSGNVSVRAGQGMLITPSGIASAAMTPEMIVDMPLDADRAPATGPAPSSEWRFHQRLLRDKPDMGAVVHAHPAHCTALAINREPIPACHYMIAAFGGDSVPVAGYALFGGPELADAVAHAMHGRHGCLMANHGAVVVGETLDKALWRMTELEHLARVWILARSTGTPHILTRAEIDAALMAFRGYGPKPV
jgi:L-fuculose-phosphate aldolase